MIYVLTNEKLSIGCEEFEYINNIEYVIDWFNTHQPKVVGVDTETTGLDFLDDKVLVFQIGTIQDQFVIDTRYHSIEPLRAILESKSILKVLQNVSFDYKMIRNDFNITIEHVFDTMLVDKVINCGKNMRSGLDVLADRYLGEYLPKVVRLDFVGGWNGPYTLSQILYASKDVTVPLRIYEKQLYILKKENLLTTANLENNVVLAFADIEYNGIGINKDKWLSKADESNEQLTDLKASLNQIIEENQKYFKFQDSVKQLDFFIDEDTISFININWDSPGQVLKIFQTDYPQLESVGADILHTLENKPPLIGKYVKYKQFSKLYGSYGPSFLEHVKSDGRIHTSFKQILNTGRVSSSQPNMQQIPADNSFRNCFTSGDPDWVFVSSDFSSQELCVIATISKDPVWLKALEQGKDLHSVCAALVFGPKWENAAEDDCAFYERDSKGDFLMKKCNCPKHGKLRTGVKSINFGLAYGMSEYALSDRMEISVQEARNLIETYFHTFPKIRQALENFGEFGKKYGYIMTMPPFKRKRFFKDHKFISKDPTVSGTIERASKNTPIQGSSADMTKLALIYTRNYINKYSVPVKLVMTVHDQIDTIVHKDYVDVWKVQLQDIMERAALKIITNGLLKAETEISKVWKK